MPAAPQRLLLLTGPTACGKSSLGLEWASELGAEIINADALLFYRGMDIGTAKPSDSERARVRHHLINVCAVDAPMDVATYAQLARAAVREIAQRGKPILVVGGSGFYLSAFFRPVADAVAVAPELRAEVLALEREQGIPGLLSRLDGLNPQGTGSLDRLNPRRVVRALERCLASGRSLQELAEAFAAQPCAFADCEARLLRIRRERTELEARIDQRTRAMIDAGLAAEVEQLRKLGLERNPSAASAIGYRETLARLRGEKDWSDWAEEICVHTRQLVRKQEAWLRHQLPEHAVLECAGVESPPLPPELSRWVRGKPGEAGS